MLSVVGWWQVCIDEGQDIQCNSWWHQISERDAAYAYSEVFCCQGGLSFFSCTYPLIFLCKDINLKISVILVRHTCILLEHNKFVHKDIRALSEIYKDDKMITNLFVERILFLLQGSINGKVCTLMHISFQFYFNYFSSLVLNIINWYTLLYSIYWILTRTPWHWKRDLCWNYWGHQQ